jgi:hypothetical protein
MLLFPCSLLMCCMAKDSLFDQAMCSSDSWDHFMYLINVQILQKRHRGKNDQSRQSFRSVARVSMFCPAYARALLC